MLTSETSTDETTGGNIRCARCYLQFCSKCSVESWEEYFQTGAKLYFCLECRDNEPHSDTDSEIDDNFDLSFMINQTEFDNCVRMD